MSIFSWLTASPEKSVELLDKVTSGVGSWIDEQQFTEQESTEAQDARVAQRNQLQLEMFTLFAQESTPRSITRRVLAVVVMGLYTLMFIFGNVLILFTVERGAWLDAVIKFIDIMNFSAMCMMVMGTYFVYYGAQQVLKQTKNKS